jgi:S1-C subfamily serine protease
MKIILGSLLILSSLNVSAQLLRGINPTKVKQSPFYLYKNFKIDEVNNKVKVLGFSYSKTGREVIIDPEGNNQTISLDKFIFYRRLGSSSFEATAGSGTAVGTAFLVGNNFVLTNKHVADTDNIKKACNHFAITLETTPRQEISCKKVWYCDSHDFCLIEMNKSNENKSIGEYTTPLSLSSTLAQTGSTIHLIGNSFGLGVQGSEGKDFTYVDRIKELGQELAQKYYADSLYELNFYAPSLGGSSGSPIYDNAGTIVGINYAHSSKSGSSVGDDVTNHAVPAYYIINQLKKNLPAEIISQLYINRKNLERDEEYRSQWLSALKESKQPYIFDFDKLFSCINDEDYKSCEDMVANQFNLSFLKKKYSLLNLIELNLMEWSQLNLIKGLKEIANASKNLNVSYFDIQKLRKECANEKNLTSDCLTKKQIQINVRKLPYFAKIAQHYNENQFNQIVEVLASKVKKIEADYYFELQNIVHNDKALNLKFYQECLKGVKKLFIKDGLFDGYSTPLYHETCTITAGKVMSEAGYKIEESEMDDLKIIIQSSPIISKLNESFTEMVMKKWKVFVNQPLKSKDNRHKYNVKLIEEWSKKQSLDLDEKIFYDIISTKFRFFYF